jgi:hypothetical protein
MNKIASGLPVKTRVPPVVWFSAGLMTFVSLILNSNPIVEAAPRQLANVAHLFSASIF